MQSFWQASSRVAPPDCPPLDGSQSVDVAVVGGGFTGLASAYFLSRNGAAVAVLEAEEPGFGASGRNGGQVLSGWPVEMIAIKEKLGRDVARALWDISEAALARVREVVEKETIDCRLETPGHLEAADSPAKLAFLQSEGELLSTWTPGRLECWDASRVQAALGTNVYVGGLYDPESMAFHPLDYVRGLARAAQVQGVRIYGHTAVARIQRRSDGWELQTSGGGTITCQELVLATNAYPPADAHWLKGRILPVTSTQLAVQVPPDVSLPRDLPTVSDTKRDLNYYRRFGDMFLFGGRASQADLASGRFTRLHEAMLRMFPQLEGATVMQQWSGRIALSADFIPHAGKSPEGYWTAGGYTGHGAALSTELGYLLAGAIAGHPDPAWLTLIDIPWRRFPLSPLLGRVLPTLFRVMDLTHSRR
ncbi:NAD(P)/FAD-dependent oxidoreductase [Sulfobacillus harzensis]|uniref:FAD-binding oxidoreductase n=1 Tax=Sulfobacillus harzensis TaxID=2729629 RepID=A0A7Y0L1N6_9FIRM|nr:FAD-binding oxidoreductase [Sulfobacillus harzensis]NMP21116.1 FAD-binding oxidoreductase [Sulfobacillus harzensis]